MKEQRTKQILICLTASLGCFWLGNRVGVLYVSAAGTVTQRLAAAVNLSKIVLHPLLDILCGHTLQLAVTADTF